MRLFMKEVDKRIKHNMWCQWGDLSYCEGKVDLGCVNSEKNLGKM